MGPGHDRSFTDDPELLSAVFYHTDKKLAAQEKWPPSRAEEVIEIEKDLLREYADPDLKEPQLT